MRVLSICLIIILGGSTGDSKSVFAKEILVETESNYSRIKINLDQAIELMKREHPDIYLQEIAVEKATQEVELATRAFLPDIDIDYIASSASGGLGLIMTAAKLLRPIFTFKQLMIDKEVKKILKEKEEVLVGLRELEVVYAVKELYVMLLIQQELTLILEENRKRSLERYELKKIHHSKGALTDEELLKGKLEYGTARTQAETAKTWLRQSEFSLARLLGLPIGESFSLSLVPFANLENFPLSLEECLIVAYDRNPLIEALLLEEKASWKRLGKKEPRFSVDGAFMGLGDSSNGLFSGAPRFGVTGNFVLHDWGKRRLKKNILGLEDKELSLKHEKEFQEFESSITKTYFDLKRLQSEIATSETRSELFHESGRRNEILEEIGRVRRADALSFENESALQKAEYTQKRFEYFLVRARLIKDLGLSHLSELTEVTTQ